MGDARKELKQIPAMLSQVARTSATPVNSTRPRSDPRTAAVETRLAELSSDAQRAQRQATTMKLDAAVDAKMDSRADAAPAADDIVLQKL